MKIPFLTRADSDKPKTFEIILKRRRSKLLWLLAAAAIGQPIAHILLPLAKDSAKDSVSHIENLKCATSHNPENSLIAVINVKGTIGSTFTAEDFLKTLQKIADDNTYSAIALKIDSPGGTVYDSFEIQKLLVATEKQCQLPIYSFIDQTGASGAYLIALTGREIYARSPFSVVGSVGVILSYPGFDKIMDKVGVEMRVHKTGDAKGGPSPFAAETAAQTRDIQAKLRSVQTTFLQSVKDGRGDRLKITDDDLLQGGTWHAVDAAVPAIGLIDGIANLDDIMAIKYPKASYVTFDVKSPEYFWSKYISAAAQIMERIDTAVSATSAPVPFRAYLLPDNIGASFSLK